MILVQPVHSAVQMVYMARACCAVPLAFFAWSPQPRRLVGLVGGRLCLMDAGLGTTVHILDVVRVLGIHFIQFVQPVLHRVEALVHPLFAGEWVHLAPESFMFGVARRRGSCGLLRRRLGRCAFGRRGLLRNGRKSDRGPSKRAAIGPGKRSEFSYSLSSVILSVSFSADRMRAER